MKKLPRVPFFKHILACLPVLGFLSHAPLRAQGGGAGSLEVRTVVIDPGHGGKDPGCISRDGKTREKDITLDIARRLAKKISLGCPGVQVKMTRTDDRFVELDQRAAFANEARANLFLSIHVNAVDKGKASPSGYSIHCLGQSSQKGNDLFSKNLDLVKRENAVILLEDDYKTVYQGFDPDAPQSSILFSLMQNAHLSSSLSFAEDVARCMGTDPVRHCRGVSQDPFWVLWRTAMPSVLVEVGFITHPDDLKTLRGEAGRERIAENLFQAFLSYKARFAVRTPAGAKTASDTTAAPGAEAQEGRGVRYGLQVLATSREVSLDDPFFHGHVPVVVRCGGLLKYILGASSSLETARKAAEALGKLFPDGYLVQWEGEDIRPVR